MFSKTRITAACCELGISPRHARLYNHIYILTKGGKRDENTFEVPRDKSLEIIMRGLSKLGNIRHIQEQMEDLRRMYKDPAYRQIRFQEYHDRVLPAFREMGIRKACRILADAEDIEYTK